MLMIGKPKVKSPITFKGVLTQLTRPRAAWFGRYTCIV
jgi:hypothetical protein